MTEISKMHNISKDDQHILYQISKVKECKSKKDSAHGDYTSRLERAESAGMDKWALKESLKILKKGEVSETVQRLTALLKYLRLLGMPVSDSQLDMFETAPASQPLDEKAFEHGMGCGVLGEGQGENPHDMSTEAGQAWLKGWHEGCAARKEFADSEAQAEEDDEAQTDIEDAA